MDTQSLYYFAEMAKDMHISRTAERLFVSQQTLSNHLARLEEHFGVRLMERKPSLALTGAGEFVLAYVKTMSREYFNLTDVLSDIEGQERGILRFGANPLRLNACMPEVMPRFAARYPKVEVRLSGVPSDRLQPMVLRGELDFAAVLEAEEDPQLVLEKLMDDPVYLCVPDELLHRFLPDGAEELKRRCAQGTGMETLGEMPICLHTDRLGHRLTECFVERGLKPNAYLTSSDSMLTLTLCAQGQAACFATHMRLVEQKGRLPAGINVFPLLDGQGRPVTQTLSLVRRRDRYLSHYSKWFLALLQGCFSRAERMKVARLAETPKEVYA